MSWRFCPHLRPELRVSARDDPDLLGIPEEETGFPAIYDAIDTQSFIYMIVYFIMIIGFSYFYSTIQFNPVEIANNLKKQGGFIPGSVRGQATVDFTVRS